MRLGARGPRLDRRWEVQFEALVAFKERHGHVNGPFRIHYPSLSQWVTAQRRYHRQQRLAPDRERRLSALGLEWSGKVDLDAECLGELARHRRSVGHFWVAPSNVRLNAWTRDLRQRLRSKTLSARLLSELARISYPLDDEAWQWERRFASLADRVKAGKGFDVGEPSKLGPWIADQRRLFSAGKLAPDRVRRLRALRFPFVKPTKPSMFENRWIHRLNVVSRLRVLNRTDPLASWVLEQRRRLREGKLKPERARALMAVDVRLVPERVRGAGIWNKPQTTTWSLQWDENFERLKAFNRREGHTRVPRYDATDRPLGLWVQQQRTSHAAGRLDPIRHQRLKGLGFQFDPFEAKWRQMILKLQAFKLRTGDANVTKGNPGEAALGAWLHSVRRRRVDGELSPARIAQLTELGVIWDREQLLFERAFRKLADYAAKRGHCVPLATESAYGVAHRLRELRRAKRLRPEWIKRLDGLGFAWEAPRRGAQDDQPHQLAQHFAEHGHHEIPSRPPYRELFDWVERQRRLFREGQISPAVLRPMRELGFPLEPSDIAWERFFSRALAFKQAHAHLQVPPSTPLGRWLREQWSRKESGELNGDRSDRLDDLGVID